MKNRRLNSWIHACFWALVCIGTTNCEQKEMPFDGTTMQRIDSISTAQIRTLRIELDSQCNQRTVAELPYLIDSIKKERLREIEVLKKNEEK